MIFSKDLFFWLLCFIIVFTFTNKVFAEEAAQEEVIDGEEDIVSQTDIVVRNDIAGIWFPMDVARQVLSDIREVPLLRRQISLLGEQLTLREGQIDRMRQQVESERAGRQEVVEEIEGLQEQLERAEDRSSAWHRSPVFWFVIGSLSTIALVVAGAAILKSVQPSLMYSID